MSSKILTLHDPERARAYYAAGLWRDETLYAAAVAQAASRPDAEVLVDRTRRLTWTELVQWVDSVAADLSARGLRTGDRVGVWLPNCVEAVVTLLACSRNGYICAPSLHKNHTVAEVVTLMRGIRASALVVQVGYGADADTVQILTEIGAAETVRLVYALKRDGPAASPLAGAVDFPSSKSPAVGTAALDNPDKITYLAFTSGTTGQPKAVMHSDNTLLANGRGIASDWGFHAEKVIYLLSPLSHHIATVAVEHMLVSGCKLVVNDLRKGETPLDRILETRATCVMGVPTHAIDILNELDRRKLHSLGQVDTFYMAGAAIPIEVAKRFLVMGITPQNVYGMTENGSHQYTRPDDSPETMVGTCGKSCAGYEVRIWNADNRDEQLPEGVVGEIGGRGACLMLGYFDNQNATESSFNRHGWFMSGDLGRLDASGNLTIVGRSKDVIIRGGHNIYPSEIENLMIRHPDVLKAAAFSVPDERLGEKVCIALINKDGKKVGAGDMVSHLKSAGLSRYDMPEYFLTLEEFPLTASGKVLKRVLSDQVRAGVIQPETVQTG